MTSSASGASTAPTLPSPALDGDWTIGASFAGFGGLDEAVREVFGGRVAWVSEIDKGPCAILAHNYPDAPNLGDIKAVDWSSVPPVDIYTGGYPCQPFSGAGKRLGTDDPRHLFPFFAKGVEAMRPRIVVAENVRGHLSLGFDVVLAEWVRVGYDVQWMLIRAADVGAPHGRARLFILATNPDLVAKLPVKGRPVTELVNGVWSSVEESLFGRDAWAGKWPVAGRLVDGVVYDNSAELKDVSAAIMRYLVPGVDVAVAAGFVPESVSANGLLPTPVTDPLSGNGHARHLGGEIAALLPSPTAALGSGGQTSRSGDRKGEVLLAGVAEAVTAAGLLRTPRASRGASSTEIMYLLGGERCDDDRPQGQVLLPTPVASLANGTTPSVERSRVRMGERGVKLDEAVMVALDDARVVAAQRSATGRVTEQVTGPLLKTPTAQLAVNGGSQHPDRRKAGGHGPTLADEVEHLLGDVRVLPTPTAADSRMGRNSTAKRTVGSRHHAGSTLTDVVVPAGDQPVLLPTPTRQDGSNHGGPSQFRRHTVPLNATVSLLPSPRASDGVKGGPNMRGSAGDLMLPSAVHHMTDGANALAVDVEAGAALVIEVVPGDAPGVLPGYEHWGVYGPAIARWERVLGRRSPSPTVEAKSGAQRLSPRFVEWMMGQPDGWITSPAIWTGWTSSAARNAQLKACGNGVVTLQAATALRLMLATR